MKEYERSFEVKSIKPYLKYCNDNNYEKKGENWQNRIVYENKYSEDIIARITTKKVNGKKQTIFDCKNVGKRDKNLKVSNESIPILINNKNKESIASVLNVLGFFKAADNTRTRYEYVKDNVKFEIDDYSSPKMQVVAIEGEEKEVEKIYKDILEKIKE